jgi:hypothetical protein
MTKQEKKQFDDVLKRMLGTPPKQHKQEGTQAKKAVKSKKEKAK